MTETSKNGSDEAHMTESNQNIMPNKMCLLYGFA